MLRVHRIIALLLLCLVSVAAHAADGDFVWARGMGGTGDDRGYGIAVDSAGNIYTTGSFQGTADFDPGEGTFNLTSAGNTDIFVQKLDANGTLVWARGMGGGIVGAGNAIVVDGEGNVYTTGEFYGAADFDPGADTVNLTSAGAGDIFVQKLDASGNLVWARGMGGTGYDRGQGIAVDRSGSVYTTGYFVGTSDFDPEDGVFNLINVNPHHSDIFVQKLDVSGNFVWARGMGGQGTDMGRGIAVDSSGSVYTTGHFASTVDFDPGEGTFNLGFPYELWNANSFFVQKLDTDGNFLWVRDMDGHPRDMGGVEGHAGLAISVDGTGNVLTTGYIDVACYTSVHTDEIECRRRIFVKKNDQDGNVVWTQSMGGDFFDVGSAVAVDRLGNVYTTGSFMGNSDFDPGGGVFFLTSAGYIDNFVQKLDVHGRLVWAKSFGGGNQDSSRSIAVDDAGNVFTTGKFYGTADFDPGAGTLSLSSAGYSDIFIQKLEAPPDVIPPNATNIAPGAVAPTNAISVDFTVTFDEDVQNFDAAADLVITHDGTASAGATFSGGPRIYTVTITGISGDGSFTLALNTASDVQDFAGNPLATSVTSAAVAIDNTPPTVSIGGPSGSPVNSSGTVAYPVTVDGAGSITLTSGNVTINHSGTAGGSVVVVDGTSEAPMVQVSGVSGSGSYTISIAAGIASDAAGNTSLASSPSSGTVIVDNTAPTVIIGAPIGSPVNRHGTASFPMMVSGSGRINLSSANVTINHDGTAGGSVVVVDRVTVMPKVQVSGVTGDGSYTISIAAGIATDAVGNVSLEAGPSSGAVSVDNTAPEFSNVVANPSEASTGDTVTIGFESSEPIVGDPNVTVNGNQATSSAKAAFAFEYTVLPGDALGAATIEISGVDGAGNVGTLSDATSLTIADGEGEGAVEGAPDGEGEGSVEGEGEGVGEGEGEGALEGEGEGNVEGQGEGEEPPVGCSGCNPGGGPMEKSLGDWLAAFLGLAVLLGVHVSLRSRLEA